MRSRRAQRLVVVASLVALIGSMGAPRAASALSAPDSVAATGDSITRAFNLCWFPFIDCPQYSWSTGSHSSVNSHARRLGIVNSAHNNAVSGAKMIDLEAQMDETVRQGVDYVTVLMGANDLCTSSIGTMTDEPTFRQQFTDAMETVTTGLPEALVYVVSIPDIYRLWELLKDNSSARQAWDNYNICQSLLANPLSTDPADVDRRNAFRAHNELLNATLLDVCDDYAQCVSDGGKGFETTFEAKHISTRDYFHPSREGQAYIAEKTWEFGPYSTPPDNAAPSAGFTYSCTDLSCRFTDTSTDSDGSIASWSWDFGDGSGSTAQDPSHTFAGDRTYTVTLTVTDGGGATGSTSQDVTVSSGGSGGGITLSASGYKVKGTKHTDLEWSGTTSDSVDVYRDGAVVDTTANDGAYTDDTGQKGGGSHTYQVCEAGTPTCSAVVTVTF